MLTLEEAVKRVLAAVPPLAAERVAVDCAQGRFLAEEILAPADLPRFDNASMDGYAAREEDIVSASPATPVKLRLVGQAAAGQAFAGEVEPGAAVRVYTGSPLPRGANTVIPQEDTQPLADDPQSVLILEPARPWRHVRLKGEDVKAGAVLARRGEPLTAGRICLLAASGVAQVQTARPPRVGVLATGSELYEPGQPLGPGGIYECNRAALAALIRNAGGEPVVYPLVPDQPAATRAALQRAFDEGDAVVTTGGVSVGDFDCVKTSFTELGGRQEFWRVAIKPGRPFVFGQYLGKPLFGLPGNPASALVTFLLLVRPALLRMQGALEVGLPTQRARLAESLMNRGERRQFLRVVVDSEGLARSAGLQGSHGLAALAAANALLELPPNSSWEQGAEVTILRY